MSQRESAPRPTPTRISKAGPGGFWQALGADRPQGRHPGCQRHSAGWPLAGPWGLPGPKTGTQGGNVSQRESAPRPTPTRISKAGPKGSGSGSQGGIDTQQDGLCRSLGALAVAEWQSGRVSHNLSTGKTAAPQGHRQSLIVLQLKSSSSRIPQGRVRSSNAGQNKQWWWW